MQEESKTKKPVFVKGYVRNAEPEIEAETKEPDMTGREWAVFIALSVAYIFALLVVNAPQIAGSIIVAMTTLKLFYRPVRKLVRQYQDSKDPDAIKVNTYFRKKWLAR